jgi:hypothetical protein
VLKNKISKYIYDSISVGGGASEVQSRMDNLKIKGWKDLRFCQNNRDCDCSSDEIRGYRPRTLQELKVVDKWIASQNKQEIKEMYRLVKNMGI